MEVTQLFMQRVKPAVWDRIVTLLIQTAELEEIGEGQYAEELRGYIQAYLDDRPPAEAGDNSEKAELLRHPRPIQIEGVVWIRIDHFHRWVATTMHDRIHKSILCARMKEVGCQSKVLGARDPSTQKVVNSRRWSVPEWPSKSF